MAASEEPPNGDLWPLLVGGSLLVAASTPLNLVWQLLCWPLVGDGRQWALLLVAGAVNVAMFLALCRLALRWFGGPTLVGQSAVILVVLVLHLSIWLGWSSGAWRTINL